MTGEIRDAAQRERFRQARLSRDARFDGRFFVAVKSTGIFCRPICPARLPSEENVSYYQHATQASHAGFRPCLRCRPDSAPASSAWQGVETTVVRAEKLLSEIPPQPVSDIAIRLGVSERYLHKLLTERVGMSPNQWQKYQQLLFAKRLLQQSDLSVEDVAIAAGFGSSRRLQALMKKYWQLTPGACRGNRKTDIATATSVTVMLHYREPYNWSFVRDFLMVRAIPGTETLTENSYTRVFAQNHNYGQLHAVHKPARRGFAVTVNISDLRGVRAVLDTVSRVLDLHAEPDLIANALNEAGVPLASQLQGIRLPGVWSAFEAGCRAVLGQQVSVKAAINNVVKVVDALGESTPWGKAFPAPSAVAHSELEFLKMPGARKQALRNLAGYFADSVENAMPGEPDLLALKGIGPWTVDYLIMRGCSEPDRYLAGDLIVRKVAATRDLRPEKAAPWRSYLTLQMWQLANENIEE